MLQIFTHYFLHFVFPLLIAFLFFRKDWGKVYFIMLSTMMVDLDHFLANPIYKIDRCSINFHPLHTYYAMVVYIIMILFKKPFNIIGIGLTLHMLTDFIDCLMQD